jgi:hypothetical protein
MKKIFIVALLLLSPSAFAGYWYSEARSSYGSEYGFAQHIDKFEAERIALYQCAIRTKQYDKCIIVKSYWVY